ncbi:hypothetical protein PV326_003731 [Microctonus aethiopoides]|nr:hypothetical protein PV326_003731 [Microctonus aethiopoides]
MTTGVMIACEKSSPEKRIPLCGNEAGNNEDSDATNEYDKGKKKDQEGQKKINERERVNLSSSGNDRKDSDRDFCSTDAHPRTHPSSTQMKKNSTNDVENKKKKSKGKKMINA